MTTVRQLYQLQEMDLILDSLRDTQAKVEEELLSGPRVGQVETALEEERERLPGVQGEHKARQLEVESLRERSTRLEQQLYGGEVTNARDLRSLEQEVENVRQQLEQQDAELLDLSMKAEESQQRLESLEQELSDGLAAWEVREAELQAAAERWGSEVEAASQGDRTWLGRWMLRLCSDTKDYGGRSGEWRWPRWSGACARLAGCRSPPRYSSV